MKRISLNLEEKENIKECFDTICSEIEILGFNVPAEITAQEMRDSEGFSFDGVSVSFYWDEDGQFATIEVIETSAEETEAETEETTEETHIVEVAIISKYGCKYAVTYFSDGTTVESATSTPEMMNFINLMVARGCFEIIFGSSASCIKLGGCYKNTDEFDISISAGLDVRIDEHLTDMPFDKFNEGVWHHATGYSVLIDTRFVTEYSA